MQYRGRARSQLVLFLANVHQLPLEAAPLIKQFLWLRAGDIDESDADESVSESEDGLESEEASATEEALVAQPPQRVPF